MLETLPLLENKYINLDQSDYDSVLKALGEKELAGTAKIIPVYEERLATYFGVKHALAVSSGTAALHLLLYLYDVKAGDEVIVPPTAPIMSALPIIAVGAIPVFVDVEPESFSYDIDDLQRKITSRTKAIVTVPMWGYPTNTVQVKEIAIKQNIPLIEDASHCHGSRDRSFLVGTVGDVGFFSTQERKLVATGEGGFILTDSDDIADRVREIRDFGKPFRKTPELENHLGQYGYLFGLNFRISAMSAAIGIPQLEKLSSKISMRTQNAESIKSELTNIDWLQEIDVSEGVRPNYYSIVFFVSHPTKSTHDIAKMLYSEGIVSDTYRFGIKPLYALPIFKRYRSVCPNTESILQRIITLPTHEGLSSQDIKRIVAVVRSFA